MPILQHFARRLISIHAPLAGSDWSEGTGIRCRRYFNPRSPRGERPAGICRTCSRYNFNPRSPRGERRCGRLLSTILGYFNPRSPRGERRLRYVYVSCGWTFQSTLPSRGATPSMGRRGISNRISIHAPLAGSDNSRLSGVPVCGYFNPRSPRGERRDDDLIDLLELQFQSTLPSRGATDAATGVVIGGPISIHAPLAGSDVANIPHMRYTKNFNPRSPRGERPREWDILAYIMIQTRSILSNTYLRPCP